MPGRVSEPSQRRVCHSKWVHRNANARLAPGLLQLEAVHHSLPPWFGATGSPTATFTLDAVR